MVEEGLVADTWCASSGGGPCSRQVIRGCALLLVIEKARSKQMAALLVEVKGLVANMGCTTCGGGEVSSKNVVVVGGGGCVPDRRSRDHEVVVVRRKINLGTGNLEWGGDGNGEISLRATWGQGGRDPITARRVPSK
jgi:hypothetical protein